MSAEILDDEEEPVQLSENRLNRPQPSRKKHLETQYEFLWEDAVSMYNEAVSTYNKGQPPPLPPPSEAR